MQEHGSRHVAGQVLNPGSMGRVRGQEFGWLSLSGRSHIAPQADTFSRVKASASHVLQAQQGRCIELSVAPILFGQGPGGIARPTFAIVVFSRF
jgi:hypothetical protein